jgi:ABC-2 type transport system permease protein
MLTDMWTVMRKELRELLLQRTSVRANLRGGWLSLLIILAVFGVFLPLRSGPDWVQSPAALLLWAWVPLFLVSTVTADSFAGERERHTLETLLASRLSDRDIFFGKVAAAIAYGWGLGLLSIAIGLITVNVAYARGHMLLYPLNLAYGGVALSLLASGLSATAGTLISLRASTARQAAQTTSIAIMLLLFIPVFGVQALPAQVRAQMAQVLSGIGIGQLVLGAAGVLALVDALLLLVGMARFKRAKLILD